MANKEWDSAGVDQKLEMLRKDIGDAFAYIQGFKEAYQELLEEVRKLKAIRGSEAA